VRSLSTPRAAKATTSSLCNSAHFAAQSSFEAYA
jgi:hypothetical protein